MRVQTLLPHASLVHISVHNETNPPSIPQWDTREAEMKDPSVENPELEGSPFKSGVR